MGEPTLTPRKSRCCAQHCFACATLIATTRFILSPSIPFSSLHLRQFRLQLESCKVPQRLMQQEKAHTPSAHHAASIVLTQRCNVQGGSAARPPAQPPKAKAGPLHDIPCVLGELHMLHVHTGCTKSLGNGQALLE